MADDVKQLQSDAYYKMAKLLGMDTSKYVITDDTDFETVKKELAKDLHQRVRENSAEQNESDLQTLGKDKKQGPKFAKKFEQIMENIQKDKAPSPKSNLEKEKLYQQAVGLGISLPSYSSTSVSYSQYEDILRDIEKRIKDSGHEPVEHYPTKEEQKAYRKAEAEKSLHRNPFYRIAQQIGIDVSAYEPQNPADLSNDLAKIIEQIKEQLPEYLRNNDIETFRNKLLDIRTQAQKDGWKADENSIKILEAFVNINTNTPTEEKDKEMSNEWMDKLIEDPIYKAAVEAGLIAPGSITIDTEEQLHNQLERISGLLNGDSKSSVNVESAEGNAGVPETEQPTTTKEAKPEVTDTAETGEKPAPGRKSLVAETAPTDENLPAPVTKKEVEEKSWMDEKREVWKEFADSIEHGLVEEDKDNQEKTELAFSLSKDKQEVKGKVIYSSETNVQITPDSDLLMYQGLVHDAIKGEMSLTFGASLSEEQKLMLYAAALMSTETYKNGEKIELIGMPEIDPNSKVFESLPKEVREVLMAEVEHQATIAEENAKKKAEAEQRAAVSKRVAELRQIIGSDDANHTQYKATLSKEQLKIREEKESIREKIMAARLGITEEYETTYMVDVKDKEGNIIHHKGDKRIVKQDATLVPGTERVPQEVYEALVAKYGKGKGE